MFKLGQVQQVKYSGLLNLLFVAMVMAVSMLVVPSIGEASMTATSGQLVSYWKLDETSGTREDAHFTNDLTDNNTVTYRTGVIGNSADFTPANSEYLSILDVNANGIHFQDAKWSFNYWIYWDSFSGAGVFAHGNFPSAYNGLFCQVSTVGGNWYQCFGDPNNTDTDINFSTSKTLSTGAWTMTTLVFDGDKIYEYKNGSLSNTVDIANGVFQGSTAPWLIGAGYWTSVQSYCDCSIDEVSYWNTNLASSTDIVALYNSGAGLAYADLFGSGTSTATTTTATSTVDVEELKWVVELYLAVFMFLIFTFIGYRFTKMFI